MPGITVFFPKNSPSIEMRIGHGVTDPVPRHWHSEYQVCCIRGGSGTLEYGRRTTVTPPQSLFVIPPGEVHANVCTSPAGCDYQTLFIPPPSVAQALGEDLPLSETVIDDTACIEVFGNAFRSLQDGESLLQSEAEMARFLSLLLPRGKNQSQGGEKADHVGLVRSRGYIEDHFDQELPLSRVARIAGLSPYHFTRTFCEKFGSPPHLFQTQLRVVRAKALLREGLPIGEVALKVGFADQSHLNRHFRKLTAVTPGQYARTFKR